MGTTKDTRGDWCSGRWLTAGSASVCQPEPEKRLDYASTSEHRCSFDHTLYCVSYRMQAQYHTTRAPCQGITQTETHTFVIAKSAPKILSDDLCNALQR